MDPSFERIRVDRFDPDRLVEVVSDGAFEHRLLDGGPFWAELRRLKLPASRIDSGSFSRPCFARGAFPAGWMCIGFTVTQHAAPTLDGVRLASRDLQVYAEGSAIDYRSAPQAVWMAIQVRRDDLQQQALSLNGCELDLPTRGYRNIRLPTATSTDLQATFRNALDMGPLLGNDPGDDTLARRVEHGLLVAVARALARPRSEGRANPSHERRTRIVRSAEQFLAANVDRPFRIDDLAAATKTSQRTLEYVFQDVYGVSPRDWFLSGRLHRVRHELRAASTPKVSVSSAAARWGVKHLGRFAGEYRKLFGELPSRTLAGAAPDGTPNVG